MFDKIISLVLRQLKKLKELSNDFKMSESNIKWLQEMKELLLIVSGQFMVNLTSLNSLLIAYKCLGSLLECISLIKEIFTVKDKETSEVFSFFEKLSNYHSEGIDFSNEFVFETSHPYPRGDSLQRETISNSRAIGFVIEFDKRCSAENQDILTISTEQ